MSGQLSAVNNESIKHLMGNFNVISAGAAQGTTSANDVKSTATVTFCINGVWDSQVAAEPDISATTFLNEDGGTTTHDSGVPETVANIALPDLKSCKYLICFNGTAWAVVQAAFYDNGDTAVYPACPPGYAPFYVVTLVNTSGSAFTFGAAALTTTGIADTYENVSRVPSRHAAA